MKKTPLLFLLLSLLVCNKGQAMEGPLVLTDMQGEIAKTRQTLAYLEGYLSGSQGKEDEIVIDYKRKRVSDFKDALCVYYPQVLQAISDRTETLTTDKPIRVELAENYLTDEGVQRVVEFILSHDYVRRNLSALNLSNNRVTKAGLSKLRDLVDQCPNLNLDVSINYITDQDFKEVFTTDNARVRFSVY